MFSVESQASNTYSAGSISAPAASDVYYYDGYCDSGNTSLTIVYTNSTRRSYVRFDNINIPIGAAITSAKIIVYPLSGSGGVNVTATLLDYDDCSTLASCGSLLETATTSVHAINSTLWSTARSTVSSYDITGLDALITTWLERGGYGYEQGVGFKLSGANTSQTIRSMDSGASYTPTLVITFTGGDPTLTVDMADPEVRTDQYLYCNVYNAAATDKLVVKLNGTSVYNTAIGGSGGYSTIPVLVDYTALSAGSQTIDVYITDSEGTEYASTHFDKDFTTLHSGAPTVGIDKNNSLILSGTTLFFPIGDFFTDYDRLSGAFKSDIVDLTNTSMSMGYIEPTTALTSYKSFLDRAEVSNRPVFGPGPRWEGSSYRSAKLDKMATNSSNCATPSTSVDCSYVNYFKSHASQLVWNWFDEPNLGDDTSYTRATDVSPYV